MLNIEKEIAADLGIIDITKAKVVREGKDISIITNRTDVYKSPEAAAELAAVGIEAEVINLRVLRPLDEKTFLALVAKTHRVLIVEDAWRSGSISSEISARIMEKGFYDLDAPVQRLCGVEVPVPYPAHLEDAAVPQKNNIVNAVKKMIRHD
jgi:pyruvate dehydrogenase E1 component beta subunit